MKNHQKNDGGVGTDPRSKDSLERIKFDTAIAARQFELQMFWQRSLFFWGFIAAAFIGFVNSHKEQSALALLLACFGAVCSFAWTLANRGSKFWQESWERKLHQAEIHVTGHWFVKAGKSFNSRWYTERFSVTKLVICLSDFTFLIWVGCVVYESTVVLGIAPVPMATQRRFLVGGCVGLSVAFMLMMFSRARQHTRDETHVSIDGPVSS